MTAYEILCAVAAKHGVLVKDMQSRIRTEKLVKARMEYAVQARRDRPHLSTGQIGQLINRSTWTIQYYTQDDMRVRRQTKERWRKRIEDAERTHNRRRGIVWEGGHEAAA